MAKRLKDPFALMNTIANVLVIVVQVVVSEVATAEIMDYGTEDNFKYGCRNGPYGVADLITS